MYCYFDCSFYLVRYHMLWHAYCVLWAKFSADISGWNSTAVKGAAPITPAENLPPSIRHTYVSKARAPFWFHPGKCLQEALLHTLSHYFTTQAAWHHRSRHLWFPAVSTTSIQLCLLPKGKILQSGLLRQNAHWAQDECYPHKDKMWTQLIRPSSSHANN